MSKGIRKLINLNYFYDYSNAFKLLTKNPVKVAYSSVADFVTISLTIFVLSFFSKIIETPLTEILVNLPNPEKPASNAAIILVISFIVLYLLLYLIFSTLQAVSWKLAHNIADENNSIKKLSKIFFRINLQIITAFIK